MAAAVVVDHLVVMEILEDLVVLAAAAMAKTEVKMDLQEPQIQVVVAEVAVIPLLRVLLPQDMLVVLV
jgi:hypothetical protein